MRHINKKNSGFSLIEMLVFIAVAAFVVVIIVNSLNIYLRVYGTFRATSYITTSAMDTLERMTREVKLASSVDVGLSTFDISPGVLVLNTTDSAGDPAVIEFYVDDSSVYMKRNNNIIGSLTGDDTSVNSLIFSHLTNTNSELVKIELDLQTSVGKVTKDAKFLTSAVLRSNY